MAQTATLKVFENLRKGFDEKQATLITDAIEEEVASALSSHNQEIETHLATKTDLAEVKAELKNFATKTDLAEVKAELKTNLAEVKAEILKWMFIFWAGQIGALLAILKLVIVK